MSVCPTREFLYDKLKADPQGEGDATDEELDTALKAWLDALAVILTKIKLIFEKEEVKKALKLK